MNNLLKKIQQNCKSELSIYDYKGLNNTPITLKILINTWKFVGLLVISGIILANFVGFELPINRIAFAIKFLVFMQVSPFLLLSLKIKDSYSVFMLMQYLSLLVLASSFFALYTYITAKLNFPLIDSKLVWIDKILFFDWHNYMSFISQYPKLLFILNNAYQTMIFSIVILIFTLVCTRNITWLQRFTIAYFFALSITVFIACLFPATAPPIYYSTTHDYSSILPSTAWGSNELLIARSEFSHSMPEKVTGIIGFPSFHTTAALLLIWGFYPVVWMRLFVTVVNILLIIATPFSGGHYFSDVIAGAVVAIAAILFANYLVPMKEMEK